MLEEKLLFCVFEPRAPIGGLTGNVRWSS